eukprot:686939_1
MHILLRYCTVFYSQSMVDSIKTPLTAFVIDEEESAFDVPPPRLDHNNFRERPRHESQTDFTEFLKKRQEEEKENHFDAQIKFILNSFGKQYLREYIKMKIKSSVYETIDKELNRKSFTSIPQYYHLRKKDDLKPSTHDPDTQQNMSAEIRQAEGFQPVYSLRIASSRTEIGADKNEYTAYIIVGSRISPFDSKITVCVKRFTELRTFASEIVRRLKKRGKDMKLAHEFPYHNRLFGMIDSKQLEHRRAAINAYLEDICGDENAVRHSYFLSFFDFNDGLHNHYIDDDEKHTQMDKYAEDEFRLKCIEETLEIIGMNGGIAIESDDDEDEVFVESEETEAEANEDFELNFEVPYDLHHYKNPEYKLVAAIFDIIQQQLEIEEVQMMDDEPQKPFHVNTNSNFMNSYHAALNSRGLQDIDDLYKNGTAMAGRKHSRKHSGGAIAPAPLKHVRAASIIESSFTPATPMVFHPSISSATGKVQSTINSNNYISSAANNHARNGWTAHQFKHKFHSSIRGIDGGPRIIRTASEATSDRSLSYKIPTLVSQVWNRISHLLDSKREEIPQLLHAVNRDLYPMIQEAMNDVAPIIKMLYNSSPHAVYHRDTSTSDIEDKQQQHGKYLSMFGYDGDEDSSSDSDGDEIRRSIGIRHFPFIKAMRQYMMSESRLYEFFLAFENLAIDRVFGDINIVLAADKKKKKMKIAITTPPIKKRYRSSVDFGSYIPPPAAADDAHLPHYEYIHLLRYNYSVLEKTSSVDLTERIRHIERIHNQINLILCEIIYATLKCMMKCLGDIILYKDQLEEKFLSSGHHFDQDVIGQHEDALLNILRDSGYNISFIVDDLKQKIKSEFKDYSSVIFNPLLAGISTIGQLSLNCICLMISQFVFDEGEFPNSITAFREAFISIWFDPIDYYIADFTECVFYILYQSSIGLVHSASQDLLQNNIFSYASSSNSHSSSTWYQILRGQKLKNIKKFIPKKLNKNISIKNILDLVIERTLTNIVDETLIYIKCECEKQFFAKFQKKEQRLFISNDHHF